jgi:hypothetical protein
VFQHQHCETPAAARAPLSGSRPRLYFDDHEEGIALTEMDVAVAPNIRTME